MFRAGGTIAVGTALAVLLRRPDLLYLVAPVALAALGGLLRRPTQDPVATLGVVADVPFEGARLTAEVSVQAPGADLVFVAAAAGTWLRSPTGRPVAHAVAGRREGPVVVVLPLVATRWGRHRVGPVVVTVLAEDGLRRWGPYELESRVIRVLPLTERFAGAIDVPQTRAAIGAHRSLRPGPGTELSGIRAFAAGDRLRRINWRVSLRAGALHVNAAITERDAEVLLLLDARFDAGDSGGVDGPASGIDATVRAAAALARFYLRLGDRVGLAVHAERVSVVPAATGQRQLTRLLDQLLDIRSLSTFGAEPELLDPPRLDPRALVVLLTPLVGTRVFERAIALSRRGHPVVVVDTLPPEARPPEPSALSQLALRLWRLQREARIHRLGEFGVPVVPWRGAGSLDAVLRDLARSGSAPRVRG